MMQDLRKNVDDISDESQVEEYLRKLLHKEAFDQKGLIYGMGHAVYSISDPRAQIFKAFVKKLALAKEREKDFPTGINMGTIGIAIPHTDKQHVIKGGVAIGVLKKPVHFFQMGTTDEPVEAKLVFMLAVEDPKEHLVFLQRILAVLQDQAVLARIMETRNKKEIIEIIKEKESNL